MGPLPSRSRIAPAIASTIVLAVLVASAIAAISYAFSNGQSASLVIGQPGFTTGGSATSSTGLWGPKDLTFDRSGNLWVVDTSNNRVVEFLKGGGFTTGESASITVGQSSYNQGSSSNAANGFTTPAGVAFDSSGNLWVADSGNNRILEFPIPLVSAESATIILGQPDFAHVAATTTAAGLSSPQGLAFDASGNLWVADYGNNRVLRYSAPFTSGQSASLVIGQLGFVQSTGTTTASGLVGPTAVAFDSAGNLWVVDQGNNRVLEYPRPLSTGESASLALGQNSFISSSSGSGSSLLWGPARLSLDSSGNLWVSESINNRVVEYSPPFSTGQAASLVIGQAGFGSKDAGTSANGLQNPAGTAFDSSGNLWVADYGNNRVLEFAGPPATTSSSSTTTTIVTVTSTTTVTAYTTSTFVTTLSTTTTATASTALTYTSTAVVTSTTTVGATTTTTITTSQTFTSTTTLTATTTQTINTTRTATQTVTVTSTPTTGSNTGNASGLLGNGTTIEILAVVAVIVVLALVAYLKLPQLRRRRLIRRPSSWSR